MAVAFYVVYVCIAEITCTTLISNSLANLEKRLREKN